MLPLLTWLAFIAWWGVVAALVFFIFILFLHPRPPAKMSPGEENFKISMTILVLGTIVFLTSGSRPQTVVAVTRSVYEDALAGAAKTHEGHIRAILGLNDSDVGEGAVKDALEKLFNATFRAEGDAMIAAEAAADAIVEAELRVTNKEKMVKKTELAKAGADEHGEEKSRTKQQAAHTEALRDLKEAKKAAADGLSLKNTTHQAWLGAVEATASTAEELMTASEAMVTRADERIEKLQLVIERMQTERLALAAGVKLAAERAKKMRARVDTAKADNKVVQASNNKMDKQWPPKDEP